MNYHEHLQQTVARGHRCVATHVQTVPVTDRFRGQIAWEGEVEVFALTGHPRADTCYAWGYPKDGGGWEITTVLKLPPVNSPESAVKIAIAAEARERQGHPP